MITADHALALRVPTVGDTLQCPVIKTPDHDKSSVIVTKAIQVLDVMSVLLVSMEIPFRLEDGAFPASAITTLI